MPNPQPTIEQLTDMLVAKSALSEKQPSYYETLPLLKKLTTYTRL